LTPQQYALLLLVKGSPDGRERSTVTELSRRLQLGQSTVTELVQRAEDAGLIQRTPDQADARISWLTLTPEGTKRLAPIVANLGPERRRLIELLTTLDVD